MKNLTIFGRKPLAKLDINNLTSTKYLADILRTANPLNISKLSLDHYYN
ncbi:hypothetical protein SRABI04_04327 [Chryseobacterium sp. Bi04]|nr:hypothetical protein SRABI04_04327 [Chryseobacterium sp. Bi04]